MLHFSQVEMALSATAYLYMCARALGSQLPVGLYVASFLGTWAVYLWDAERGAQSGEDALTQPGRSAFMLHFAPTIHALALVAMTVAMALVSMELHRWIVRGIAAMVFALGVGYVFRFLPWRSRFYRLKDLPFSKQTWVAAGWALGGVGLPALALPYAHGPRFLGALPLALVTFALLWLDTLLLDDRDRAGDRSRRLRSLADSPQFTRAVILAGSALLAIGAGAWGIFDVASRPGLWMLSAASAQLALGAAWVFHDEGDEVAYGYAASLWRFTGAALALLLF
jgi:hypothetical protein